MVLKLTIAMSADTPWVCNASRNNRTARLLASMVANMSEAGSIWKVTFDGLPILVFDAISRSAADVPATTSV